MIGALSESARDEPAFSNEDAFARWSVNWCDRCRYDTRLQNEFNSDVRVHPDAPKYGCPILAVAVGGRTPAEWSEQPQGSPDEYRCIEFRPNDDSPGSPEPQPVPDPPDQHELFPRPEPAVRMLVQPELKAARKSSAEPGSELPLGMLGCDSLTVTRNLVAAGVALLPGGDRR